MIKRFIDTIFHNPVSSNNKKATIWGSLFLMFISIILTALNVYKQYWFMMGTTIVLVVGFGLASFMAYKDKVETSQTIMAILCAIIFSVYAITGENEGFAILWILLIPVISMLLLGLRTGFLLSLYFQIFLIVLFYTPLSHYVSSYYTSTFIMRFPVLYFTSFGAITFLMDQRQNLYNMTRRQAYHDGLTGLYNRAYYNEIEKNDQNHSSLSVIMMDLNQLKYINDTLGHEAGDEIIKGAATIIGESFKEDFCFRIGGDEFTVISYSESIDDKMNKFQKNMNEWHGESVSSLSISYGIATRNEFPKLSFYELSKIADQRMYENKAAYYRQKGIDRRR